MNQPDAAQADPHERPLPDARRVRGAIAAAVIGNGLEWYDYIIFGFFAANVAAAIFPAEDPFVSTMLTAATFAVSYVVRPVAGVLLGIYADKAGRKPALTLMMTLMGLAMLIIVVTPDYSVVGVVAPLLVILARLLQGASIGGEFAAATALLREFAPDRRKEFYSSFQMGSQALAQMMAGGVGLVVSLSLDPSDLQAWGWRIPFAVGLLIVPVGIYVRFRVDESPEFAELLEASQRQVRVPVSRLFTEHRTSILAGFGATIAGTAAAYTWVIYLPTFVVQQLGLPASNVLASTFISGFLFFFGALVAGRLADRFGSWRVVVSGVLAFGIAVVPTLIFVVSAPSFTRLLISQVLAVTLLGIMSGAGPGLMASVFPVEVRSTGMGISYNVSVLLFGGLAPLTLTWLIGVTGDVLMLAYYGVFTATLALLALWFGRSAVPGAGQWDAVGDATTSRAGSVSR